MAMFVHRFVELVQVLNGTRFQQVTGDAAQLRILRPTSMIRWLTMLSLAVTLGMLILGGGILFDLRADAWRQAEQASDNIIVTLSQNIARNIELYDLSIRGAIQALAEPALAKTDPVIRRMALFDTSATAEYLGSMLVVNAQGDVVESSISSNVKPYNLAYREHFWVHKQRPDAGLFISRPIDGRVVNGKLITLTRRINNPDGSFGGVVLGAMRLSYFSDLFAKLDLGAKGSVTLFRNDGRIIMRRPFLPEEIDKDLSNSDTFRAFAGAPNGHFVGTAALDKVQRFYTFHHIDGLPLYLSVAVAVDDIYAVWWRKAVSIGAILTALCATSVVLCLLFRHAIQRRLVAENALREAANSLAVMATTDGLTGIPNRRFYEDTLAQEWRRAIRSETSVAVLLLDVDCFKLFNDHYGHQMGDEALKSVASCIASNVRRPADIAARYGGEEFVALLPETELRGALIVAEAVRKAVIALAIPHALGPSGYVSLSIGVAVATPVVGDDTSSFLKQADDALYQAKRSGRNRVISSAGDEIPHGISFSPLLHGDI